MPFQITIPEFPIEKGKITDSYVKKHMKEVSVVSTEDGFAVSDDSDDRKVASPKASQAKEMQLAFLLDVREHPDSGIAARYKRLGLSVRQGQKIKAAALEQELIEEGIETTTNGRLNIINITPKGNQFLSRSRGAA